METSWSGATVSCADAILRSASVSSRRRSTAPADDHEYIERYRDVFGVEPICTTLTSADVPVAPSTI